MTTDGRLWIREAVNVPDLLERDELVRKCLRIRSNAEERIRQARDWNATNPDEPPLDTSFYEAVVAWCDGEGPLPDLPQAGYSFRDSRRPAVALATPELFRAE